MANTTGLGDTIYAAVRKAINDAGDGGSGSGGSSDFSVATLTLTTPDSFQAHVIFPTFVSYGEGETFAAATDTSISGEMGMILYKGACIVDVKLDDTADPSQYSFSSTGDIEQVEGVGSYIATGDCAITITIS